MLSHKDIINLWPTANHLARDLRVTATSVRNWRRAGFIPARQFDAFIKAGRRRGFGEITLRTLTSGRKPQET